MWQSFACLQARRKLLVVNTGVQFVAFMLI